jgi:hypothetical protein
MKAKEWFKTLAATVIGAGAGAAATAFTEAGFNYKVALVAGAVAFFAYLAKSPLPEF